MRFITFVGTSFLIILLIFCCCRFNLFTGCPQAKTCTLILRGGAEQFIEETERSLHDAIMIVRRAIKNDAVVAGMLHVQWCHHRGDRSPPTTTTPCHGLLSRQEAATTFSQSNHSKPVKYHCMVTENILLQGFVFLGTHCVKYNTHIFQKDLSKPKPSGSSLTLKFCNCFLFWSFKVNR